MSSKKYNVNAFISEYLNKVNLSEIPNRDDDSLVRELVDESMYDFIYIWTWNTIEGEKEDYFVKKTIKEINIKEILRSFAKKMCITTSDERLSELENNLDSLTLGELRYYINCRRIFNAS